jgi:hypothetical protein
MKIFTALLLSVFLISHAQAETLFITGDFKTIVSAKGVKSQKTSSYTTLALYDDTTFSSSNDTFQGIYQHTGNIYTLSLDDTLLNAIGDGLSDQDIYIDNYTPFVMTVKLNKNRTKATVKMNTKLWISSDYSDKQKQISIKTSCKCLGPTIY